MNGTAPLEAQTSAYSTTTVQLQEATETYVQEKQPPARCIMTIFYQVIFVSVRVWAKKMTIIKRLQWIHTIIHF